MPPEHIQVIVQVLEDYIPEGQGVCETVAYRIVNALKEGRFVICDDLFFEEQSLGQ